MVPSLLVSTPSLSRVCEVVVNIFALIGIYLDAHQTHFCAVSIIHILYHILYLQILIDFMGGKPFDQEIIGMPDHVVSIVGWGVEDDKEHWIISKYMILLFGS